SLGSYPAITAFYTLSLHDALPIFLKLSICTGARQNGASHALVFDGAVFIGVPDPELISVREVMEDTTGAKEMVRGIRHVLVNQPIRPFRFHNCLLIISILIERKQKT